MEKKYSICKIKYAYDANVDSRKKNTLLTQPCNNYSTSALIQSSSLH